MNLRISDNQRFICDERGQPFFYLADTGWEMLHRLSREETEFYLRDRASKGFNVVQTIILAELDGLRTPNANGDCPFHALNPSQPNEAYFAHIDWALNLSHDLGITLALLPTWGDKWSAFSGAGPVVFNPENAHAYGEYLGQRYANAPNLIWVLGGDRTVENETHRAINEAMAAGITAGGSSHLKTFHPRGGQASSQYFHEADWLDFNMWQTGHGRNSPNFDHIGTDYARVPIKPVLDGEPGYEDHKFGGTPENGYSNDYDCRKSLYWALFSGACGHTYGCHPVWQFWQKGRKAVNHPRRDWREALNLPGAGQMQFARKLHDPYPFLPGTPAPEMVLTQPQNNQGEENKALHIAAIRGEGGQFALFYFPMNSTTEIQLDSLPTQTLSALWFNPRNGEIESKETLEKSTKRQFTPPDWGPDWVLILKATA